jgi:hypothetical protein
MDNMNCRRLCLTLFVILQSYLAYGEQNIPTAKILTEAEIRDMIRQSADKDVENTKLRRDYTYVRRDEERRLDGKRRVKSVESKTYEIMVLAGEPVERLIARDDKPLSEKDAKKEDEKIQKIIDKGKKESENDRRKRIEKSEKETEESRQFVREIADAYNFQYVGAESFDGRPVYVVDASPVPGYKPRHKDAKMLSKFRFRAWIDQVEGEWMKLDIECIETVSWGLFLARLHEGSRIQIEQTKVNEEVWLPKHVAVLIDARIALFKNLDVELDLTFRDYQKFRVDATIVPLGEVPPQD